MSNKRLVMKFGGTSVGSAEAMRHTADLINRTRQEWDGIVVVASAMGGGPVKVTDLLLEGAHAAAAGDERRFREIAQTLYHRHHGVVDALLAPEGEQEAVLVEIKGLISHYEALCEAVRVLGELTPRALDAMSGMGEKLSVRILAATLRQSGLAAQALDASELIVTDSSFQSAIPLPEATRAAVERGLRPLLDEGIIPVVTGFIAADESGATTTLGRGGSDYSATILGQALAAGEVWIWTDVDGIMSADPRLVPGARSIPALSQREVAELAYYGARVLHPMTIRPCVESGIPLRIKNTFNPDHPGTLILREAPAGGGGLKAVTAIQALSLVTVEGKGMIGVQGIAARTFGAVAGSRTNVLLISQASSEQSICFAIPDEATGAVVAALEAEFAVELGRGEIDRIGTQRPVAIVTAVGAGMRGTPGIAGRLFGMLGAGEINVIAIAQGSSECSISLVVTADDAPPAVRAIHDLIVS